jgi:ABC-type sulfate transport system substrate-binding protein
MKTKWLNLFGLIASAIAVVLIAVHNLKFKPSLELLNVSHAPTGGLYQELKMIFATSSSGSSGRGIRMSSSSNASNISCGNRKPEA